MKFGSVTLSALVAGAGHWLAWLFCGRLAAAQPHLRSLCCPALSYGPLCGPLTGARRSGMTPTKTAGQHKACWQLSARCCGLFWPVQCSSGLLSAHQPIAFNLVLVVLA